jgi:hypothetical protein
LSLGLGDLLQAAVAITMTASAPETMARLVSTGAA